MFYLFIMICLPWFCLQHLEADQIKHDTVEVSVQKEQQIRKYEDVIHELIDHRIFEQCVTIFHETFNRFVTENRVEFATKCDGSLVSNLELEIEKSVGKFLKEATPWAGFRGEEGICYESSDDSTQFRWFLDPIDGTISFRNGLDTFAFTLSLVCESEAVAALIDFPNLCKTYTAFKGHGSKVNGSPIHVNQAISGPKAVFALSDDYTFEMTGRQFILENLRKLPYITRTLTDIYAYCLVAEGKCIGKFDAAGALWDLWPGYLLIKEAGGKCLFFPLTEPTDDLAGSMLIGNTAVVDQVLQFLQSQSNASLLPQPAEKVIY